MKRITFALTAAALLLLPVFARAQTGVPVLKDINLKWKHSLAAYPEGYGDSVYAYHASAVTETTVAFPLANLIAWQPQGASGDSIAIRVGVLQHPTELPAASVDSSAQYKILFSEDGKNWNTSAVLRTALLSAIGTYSYPVFYQTPRKYGKNANVWWGNRMCAFMVILPGAGVHRFNIQYLSVAARDNR